jgi:hypothetical protein
MSITELLSVNSNYKFKTLSAENMSPLSPYMSVGFNSINSNKLIVVLYDYIKSLPVYHKEVNNLSKASLSTSKLIDEYIELMQQWDK